MNQRKNRRHLTSVILMASLAVAVVCLLIPMSTVAADDAQTEQARVKAAGDALDDLVTKENGIPTGLLNKSECVIILPSTKKVGFIIAGQYGRGLMTCRTGAKFDGPWSAPIMMKSTGGSVGFQAGGQATDFVILVMNDKGARALMKGKAKLGADASIAAGPVGKEAEAATNAAMSAEMLSYSDTERFICRSLSIGELPRSRRWRQQKSLRQESDRAADLRG